jgi:beta-N-acetylhexosaminidase
MIKRSILLTSIIFLYGCTTDSVVAEEAPNLVDREKTNYIVSEKSLEEKIGSMLMVGFMGTTAPQNSRICQDIYRYNLGGVILFDANPVNKRRAKNIRDINQVSMLTAQLQSCSKDGKLLIAVDQEGGRVQRLKSRYGFYGRFPKAKTIRGMSDDRVREIYSHMASELMSVGINYNLAPVVDLAINKKNRVIYKLGRSFGSTPREVIKYSSIFVDSMRDYRVISSLKHFPGHGSSLGDTHKGFVDVTGLWKREKELEPYRVLAKRGKIDTVMVAHVYNRTLDKRYPATLSAKTVNGLLRKKLGFNGVVITDDLQMGAITHKYSLRNVLKLAINAGDDLLLFGNQLSVKSMVSTKRLVDTVKSLVKRGEVSVKTIERSNARLERLKERI